MTILVQQQLREATERLIAEGENCWPATVERFTELANPAAVLALLDEIDCLNALVIERETVRIGQSLQRHDDQKQIDEMVALGIQQDKDEIARLKAENSSLRNALADKVVDSTKLRAFLPDDGGFTIGLEGGPCALLADAFGEQLYTSPAINYLQLTFTSSAYPDLGQIVVTLQRCTGKTPHELRIYAEQARDQLEAENAELRSVGEQAWMALVGYLPAHQNEVTKAAIDRCMKVLGTKAKDQQP